MNKIARLIVVILATIAARHADAQVSAEANIGATIVTPMTLSKESDLEIQQLSATTPVIINRTSRNSRLSNNKSYAAGAVAHKVVDASFTVTGNPEYAYSITVPAYITVKTAKHTLTIGTESCSTSGGQALSNKGTDSISVEGVVLTHNTDMIVAYNDNNDDVPNGLPVTINNN